MKCQPPYNSGHKYIIFIVDYFTKLFMDIPIFNNLAYVAAQYFSNHLITCFSVPKKLVFDRGTHFKNDISRKFYHL